MDVFIENQHNRTTMHQKQEKTKRMKKEMPEIILILFYTQHKNVDEWIFGIIPVNAKQIYFFHLFSYPNLNCKMENIFREKKNLENKRKKCGH